MEPKKRDAEEKLESMALKDGRKVDFRHSGSAFTDCRDGRELGRVLPTGYSLVVQPVIGPERIFVYLGDAFAYLLDASL